MGVIEEAVKIIKNSKNVMVLTGAGISTESGIPDFRSRTGVYSTNPMDLLSKKAFNKTPDKIWYFIQNMMYVANAKPNKGHEIVSDWEKRGIVKCVVTQNVDRLHKDAGSKNVIEIHGSIYTSYCQSCGNVYNLKDMIDDKGVIDYYCECNDVLKPDIVLFGDNIDMIKYGKMNQEMSKCDTLLVLGSSLQVYPVATMPDYFIELGKKVIIVNNDKTKFDDNGNVINIHNNIGDVLGDIDSLLKEV